jgi:hypothetical protein
LTIRTDPATGALGDPAALARGVEVLEELRDDVGRERFVFRRPAVFLGVERALPRDDPAHVASTMLAQRAGLRVALVLAGGRRFGDHGVPGPAERCVNQVHGVHDAPTLGGREGSQQDGHLLSRQLLQRRERGLSARAEGEMRLACVGVRRRACDKPPLFEALEDAAQVAAVDIQRPCEVDSRRCRGAGHPGVAVIPDLVEHTPFGQRERAVEEFLLQHANLARVEAVEAADGIDVLRERGCGHVRSSFEFGREAARSASVDPIVD